eukprot:813280_1
MYVGEGGYASGSENDRTQKKQQIADIVDWCEALGIYVIIDWHILSPGNPNHWLAPSTPESEGYNAKTFWKEMATLYKNKNHVLYEIANEPNGVGWSDVKSYSNIIIDAIRQIDPTTIIIVGTPTWSQDIHNAASEPVERPYHVMYTFHFYAGSHLNLKSRVQTS